MKKSTWVILLCHLLLLGSLGLFLEGCALLGRSLKGDTLALVNGEMISGQDLRDHLTAHRGQGLSIGPETVQRSLEELIERRLILQEVYRIGLDRNPAVQKDLARFIRIQSIIHWEDEVIREGVQVSEEDLWACFHERYERRRVRLLILKDEGDATKLLARVREGAGDLSQVVSQDNEERFKTGKGPVGGVWEGELTRQNLGTAAETVFSLVPEQVEVVPNGEHFQLFQAVGEVPPREEAYRKVEEVVRREVWQGKVDEVLKKRRHQLRDEAQVEIEEELLAGLESERILATGDGEDDVRTLARMNGEPITVGDFLRRYRQDLIHMRASKVLQGEKNRVILEKAILAGLEAQAALKKDYYASSPRLQFLARRRLERLLYETFYRKVALGGVSRLPEQVEGFYRRYLDRYSAPDQVRLDGIFMTERERAEGVLREIEKGADFQHLVNRVSLDPPSRYIGVWVGLDALPDGLAAAVAGLAVGQVSGIVPLSEGFLIARVAERKKGEPLPFAEVKGKVEGHYLREQGRENMGDWVRRLRQASEVRVNQELLARIQGELTSSSR